MEKIYFKDTLFSVDEGDEDLELTYFFYNKQFQLMQTLIQQCKIHVFNERPSQNLFRDQRCFVFRDKDTQDLQVIKKNILYDFSTIMLKNQKVIMTYKNVRFMEGKSKVDDNFRVRIVKKFSNVRYPCNQDQESFIFIHFYKLVPTSGNSPLKYTKKVDTLSSESETNDSIELVESDNEKDSGKDDQENEEGSQNEDNVLQIAFPQRQITKNKYFILNNESSLSKQMKLVQEQNEKDKIYLESEYDSFVNGIGVKKLQMKQVQGKLTKVNLNIIINQQIDEDKMQFLQNLNQGQSKEGFSQLSQNASYSKLLK